MLKSILALGLIFTLPWTVVAQSSQNGISADLSARVDKVFETFDKPTSPGCAVSVMRDGHIIYKHGYGMADLDHDIPITPSSIFHVASVSKQFTATAIVLLAQDGKLSLDDQVRKYIPELPDFGEPVTIRQLLHHISGVRDQWELLGLAGWRYSEDRITDDDIMGLIARQKALNFHPGDQEMYSNTGYTLLAQIVKRVSGQSHREFTTARIFAPLGMNHTHFRDNFDEIVKGQAYGYKPSKDTFTLSVTNFDTVGATSLLTTVEDLALWDENFYEPKVGGKALIQELQQQIKLNDGNLITYALGLEIGKYRDLPTVDHSGSDAGYRADILRFPSQHFSVACTCNLSTSAPSGLTKKVADIFLADEMSPLPEKAKKPSVPTPTIVIPSAQVHAYVGLFVNRKKDQYTRITKKEDAQSTILIVGGTEFLPTSDNSFRSTDGARAIEFSSKEKGRWMNATLAQDGVPADPLIRAEDFSPTVNQMREYAGNYVSEEIDPVFQITMNDGKLFLHHFKSPTSVMGPLEKDMFQVAAGGVRGKITFVRNDKHQVVGFVYDGSRLKNMSFKRKAD